MSRRKALRAPEEVQADRQREQKARADRNRAMRARRKVAKRRAQRKWQ